MSNVLASLCILFSIDFSSSMMHRDIAIVMEGHALALRSERVRRYVENNNPIAVMVQTWDDNPTNRINWRIIATREELENFASLVGNITRLGDGKGTNTGLAMLLAVNSMIQVPYECERRVIDVVSDGRGNTDFLEDARNKARDEGITINTLGITTYYTDFENGGLTTITQENPEIWLREHVMTVDGFSMAADDPSEFQRVIGIKIMREMTQLTEDERG